MSAAPQLDWLWNGTTFQPPVALDIATVERAIVAQLAATLGTLVAVEHFPQGARTYRLTHRIGAVLIRFDGTEYGKLEDTYAVIQERTLKWFIAVVVRDLGWAYGGEASGPSPGGYQILEAVRGILTGFEVKGYLPMYPLSEEFEDIDREGGVYYFHAIYAHVTMAVQPSSPNLFPILREIQALEEAGQTNVPVAAADYTFNSDNTLQLPNGNIAISSLVMTDTTGATTYVLGTDYTYNNVTGLVTCLATGSIPALATVSIAFQCADIVTVTATGGIQ